MDFAGLSFAAGPGHQVDDREKDDGAKERDQEPRQTEVVLVDGSCAEQGRDEPPQHGADDADDDVENEPFRRFMTMLASQPMMPPTMSQMMKFMVFPRS